MGSCCTCAGLRTKGSTSPDRGRTTFWTTDRRLASFFFIYHQVTDAFQKPCSAIRSRAFQPKQGHVDLPEPLGGGVSYGYVQTKICSLVIYSADHKFVQNIDQHLLESITTSQKKSVFHEGFDSISEFLSVSKSYGLLAHCTNFCVSL